MKNFDFVRAGFVEAQKRLSALRNNSPAGEVFTVNGVEKRGTVGAPRERQPITGTNITPEITVTIVSTRDQYTEADAPANGQIVETHKRADGTYSRRLIVDTVDPSPHHFRILCVQLLARTEEE